MHLTINVTHLIFLGDTLITKLFSRFIGGDPNAHITKKSRTSSSSTYTYYPKTQEEEKSSGTHPQRTPAGFAMVLTAATDTSSLCLILSCYCPGDQVSNQAPCADSGGHIPRRGLGTMCAATGVSWMFRRVTSICSKETVHLLEPEDTGSPLSKPNVHYPLVSAMSKSTLPVASSWYVSTW